jgi:GH15 family glucan-1,4-alpha-glucosidase
VRAGEPLHLPIGYARPGEVDDMAAPEPGALDDELDATVRAWRAWSGRGRFDAPHAPAARRSALVLKALTFGRTGAIVAAATTSLPESVDGRRSWDYRFSWIRDAVLASRSLARLGYEAEADAFRRFIERSSAGNADDLRVFFGVGGERRLEEIRLDHLSGHVRIGNEAARQLQLDAYGHLLEQSWRWFERGHAPDDDYWRFLVELVDAAVERWREPDCGIWEWRGEPRHFTYSKAMCWTAADRGLALARHCLRKAPERRWRRARDEIREAVLAEGYDDGRGTFVQAFGEPDLDAAVLRLPVIRFVAYDDPRMLSTVDVVREQLGDGGLLRRYDADDGLPGREGAFLACSFWLAECLARQGRPADARGVFDAATATANDLGLFAEEYDPATGRMLGNFPQAFSHFAHIEAPLALADAARSGD